MDMDISMDIHAKSVDMDMDMDGKFHIHGNPGFVSSMPASLKSLAMPADDTGTLKIIFAQIFSLPSLLNFHVWQAELTFIQNWSCDNSNLMT